MALASPTAVANATAPPGEPSTGTTSLSMRLRRRPPGRTVRIGTVVCASTRSATLPMTARSRPTRPCVRMTIRSRPCDWTCIRISSAGTPCRTMESTRRPLPASSVAVRVNDCVASARLGGLSLDSRSESTRSSTTEPPVARATVRAGGSAVFDSGLPSSGTSNRVNIGSGSLN